jgi:predicted permease
MWWRRRRALKGLDEDIRDHIARETEEGVARGLTPEEARRQALVTFGNVGLAKEDTRAVWVARWIDQALRDGRFTLRLLRRRPSFVATVVLTLAVGLGLNTAVFTVVSGVLLRELPLPESGRVVRLYDADPTSSAGKKDVTPADFVQWQSHAQTLEAMGVSSVSSGVLTAGEGDPERLGGLLVSDRFFDLVGGRAVHGRLFTSDEYRAGLMIGGPVDTRPVPVVLSHDLWQRRFNGQADVVGRSLRLDSRQLEVVGVMMPDLDVRGVACCTPALWMPGQPNPTWRRDGSIAIGRLRPGVPHGQAQAELEAIRAASLGTAQGLPVILAPPLETVVAAVRTELWLFGAASLCLLLIAAANVTNLLLAHATDRRVEMKTRLALGATRGQVVSHVLTEGIVLGSAAGFLAAAFAYWAVPLLIAAAPATIPRLETVRVDVGSLGLLAAVALALGLGCGMAACASLNRLTPETGPRTRAPHFGRFGARFRHLLTVVQVTVAMMLIVATGLLVRTMHNLGAVELGFNPDNVIVIGLNASPREFGGFAGVAEFQKTVIEQVKTLPGVVTTGTGRRPLSGGTGQAVSAVANEPGAMTEVEPVSPGYLTALRMRLIRGRLFEEQDLAGPTSVAIVSESAARHFWGDLDVLGRPLYRQADEPLSVIGVVADVRRSGLEAEYEPIVYILQAQSTRLLVNHLLIRTEGDPRDVMPAVRGILRRLSPQLPVGRVETLEEIIDTALAPRRFMLRLIGLFSSLALFLAIVGIFGVLAESVARRVQEIGVRLALGATRRTITSMILAQSARLVGVGIALGLLAAHMSREVLASFVFGVSTSDALTYAAGGVGIMLLGLTAGWLAARRAASVDPINALRQE